MPKKPVKHVARDLPTAIRNHPAIKKINPHAVILWLRQLRDLEVQLDKRYISKEHYETVKKHILEAFKDHLDEI